MGEETLTSLPFFYLYIILARKIEERKDFMKQERGIQDLMIDIEDLVDEVNTCDRYFDLDLEDLDDSLTPENMFLIGCTKAQDYLASVICHVNDIDMDNYIIGDTDYGCIMAGPIGIQHEEFRAESMLDWETDWYYKTSSDIFSLRFITCLFSLIMGRIEEVILRRLIGYRIVSVYEEAYLHLQEFIEDCQDFAIALLDGENYMYPILTLCFHLSYYRKHCNAKELNKMILEGMESLQEDATDIFTSESYLDADMKINMILRLAFMVVTLDVNTKCLPKFKEIEGADPSYNLQGLLEELGHQIQKALRKNKGSLMYRAWLEARPQIITNLEEVNENQELIEGISAVSFVGYLTGNSSIERFVKDMIDDGK